MLFSKDSAAVMVGGGAGAVCRVMLGDWGKVPEAPTEGG